MALRMHRWMCFSRWTHGSGIPRPEVVGLLSPGEQFTLSFWWYKYLGRAGECFNLPRKTRLCSLSPIPCETYLLHLQRRLTGKFNLSVMPVTPEQPVKIINIHRLAKKIGGSPKALKLCEKLILRQQISLFQIQQEIWLDFPAFRHYGKTLREVQTESLIDIIFLRCTFLSNLTHHLYSPALWDLYINDLKESNFNFNVFSRTCSLFQFPYPLSTSTVINRNRKSQPVNIFCICHLLHYYNYFYSKVLNGGFWMRLKDI